MKRHFSRLYRRTHCRTTLRDGTEAEALYDRLVLLSGQPGSGKTTIARVFEYTTIAALLRNRDLDTYREIVKTVRDCHVIEDDRAAVIGCRLPMEPDYRDFWELPYSNEHKAALFFALVQARAVLSWFRQLEADGIDLSVVTISCKPGAEAATEAIGGTGAEAVAGEARRVEGAIFQVGRSSRRQGFEEMSPTQRELTSLLTSSTESSSRSSPAPRCPFCRS